MFESGNAQQMTKLSKYVFLSLNHFNGTYSELVQQNKNLKSEKCKSKICLTLSIVRDKTNFRNIWFSHTRLGYGYRSRVCHCGHGSGCWGWHHKGGHDALIDYYIEDWAKGHIHVCLLAIKL